MATSTPVAQATIGGVPLRINPHSVKWTFEMKVQQYETVGGRVVQIYGTEMGDMTVQGQFGNGDIAKGDMEGWQEQARFAEQVKAWAEGAQKNGRPLRFLFPAKKWDFQVYIKAYSSPDGNSVNLSNGIFNPKWTLTLFIVEDATGTVVGNIKDTFIDRLMHGIGWKRTAFNGPMGESDSLLNVWQQLAEDYKAGKPYGGGDPSAGG